MKSISDYFSDYRAEWPLPYFASLFVRPPYFSKLEAMRPCLLIGGRGTGKTTALKSLRFDARDISHAIGSGAGVKYVGIYLRMNKNRVRAFVNTEISESLSLRAFAHYFNVLACQELCRLTDWLTKLDGPEIEDHSLATIGRAFGYPIPTHDTSTLHRLLGESLVDLELPD